MLHTLTAIVALAQAATITATVPDNATQAFTALEGDWQGQLEYRDYRTNDLQAIPLKVEFDTIADDTTFIQKSTFTDPGFPVLITTLINVSGSTVSYANSRAGRPFESYSQSARLANTASATDWTMTFTRIGSDDERPAAIREVMVRSADTLTVTKEVDFLDNDGVEWMFRNRVTLSAQR